MNDARYECLLDAGLPVTRAADGSVTFIDPEDTKGDAYDEAQHQCDEELAADGLITTTSSDALRTEWATFSALHECLVTAGLPLVDWPTEEVYVEQEGAFNVLESTSPVSLEDAQNACPGEFAEVQVS